MGSGPTALGSFREGNESTRREEGTFGPGVSVGSSVFSSGCHPWSVFFWQRRTLRWAGWGQGPRPGQGKVSMSIGLELGSPGRMGGESVVGGWLLKAQASLCVGRGLSEDLWAGSCSENKAPPWAQGLSIGSDPEGRGFPWLFV